MAEAKNITTVTMLDGRIVDFPGKRKLQKSSTINGDGSVVVKLDFINGETRVFTIPPELLHRFAAHGAEQKLGDAIAGLDNIDDGVEAVDGLMDRLNAGEWHAERAKDEFAGLSDLVRALVEHTGGKKTPEQIKGYLKTKSVKEKAALKASAELAPIIKRLQEERAAKTAGKIAGVDTGSLLSGLEEVQ